ncbi:MAG: 3-dehydroquinate synthase [Bdellovibrionales bacterium]|nr:3-dehydroquinate synthase [Bdellovibrionales bacterium]
MKKVSSKIVFHKKIPKSKIFGDACVLIYDRRLENLVLDFEKFRKNFAVSYPVNAGENLKSLSDFPKHIEALLEKTAGLSDLTFVGMGGGSVGDFTGFIASIYKRGVRLIHIPTTWLAAMDSSHGGKTGLNVGTRKNQIGTFYPAAEVHLIRDIFKHQPEQLALDALGELAKIGLIHGGDLCRKLKQGAELWDALPDAIRAKLKVVKKDPLEMKGHRRVLNLGHTLGHVLELEMGLSHGAAVAQGIFFSLDWGYHRGSVSEKNYEECLALLSVLGLKKLSGKQLEKAPSAERALALLRSDKKGAGLDKVYFIFVKRPGKVVQEKVAMSDILKEAQRQGFVL